MKNNFEIRGDVVAIFLNRRDGNVFETLIDTEDMDKVDSFKGRFYAQNPYRNMFYACGNYKKSLIKLHRLIMDFPKDLVIDHINHDTLDNRKANLRIVTQGENLKNRNPLNRGNKASNIPNVCWHKSSGKWQVRLMVNGKRKFICNSDTVEDAEKALRDFQQ